MHDNKAHTQQISYTTQSVSKFLVALSFGWQCAEHVDCDSEWSDPLPHLTQELCKNWPTLKTHFDTVFRGLLLWRFLWTLDNPI